MPHPEGGVVFVRRLREDELAEAFALTRKELAADVAADQYVRSVLRHNPESFWGVFRADDESRSNARLAGYLSFLFLNKKGTEQLRSGKLDRIHPSLDLLAHENEQAEVIYLWSIVARKLGAMAIPMVAHTMGSRYIGLPLCATAASEAGLRAIKAFGFKPMDAEKDSIGALFWLDRSSGVKPETPARRAHPLSSRFKTMVATTGEDVDRALAIRAAVFMTEQNCPYEEEFDGNDRVGTHILGFVDGEPAATMRIRYFAEFVKLERLAVLPRYRRTLIAREVVEFAVEFARRKGYRKVYGHAQKRLVRFWSRFGFKPLQKNIPLVFSDHEYVEMYGELEPHPEPLTMYSNPYLFLRPEGHWDEPGALDRSADRPATNPH